jgi:hypothetical protein
MTSSQDKSLDKPSVEDVLKEYKSSLYQASNSYGNHRLNIEDESFREATQALAQREEALLTYLSDMYALPIKEVLKTAEMWRGKNG